MILPNNISEILQVYEIYVNTCCVDIGYWVGTIMNFNNGLMVQFMYNIVQSTTI